MVALQTLVRSRGQDKATQSLDELMKEVVLIGTLLGGALMSNLFSKQVLLTHKFNNFSLETYS